MSIIKKIHVELSEIIKDANVIVEVKYQESFMEAVAVKSDDPNVPAPPFKKEGSVFAIKTVLKNADKIELTQTIRVPKEGWRRSLSQYKELYGGVSKSFSVKEYNTELKSIKDADILFLHHFQGTFELVVRNGFESAEAHEKITMLIANK